MASRSAPVKQVDITRAVKGATAAGLVVGGFRVDTRTGEIYVFAADQRSDQVQNDWDAK